MSMISGSTLKALTAASLLALPALAQNDLEEIEISFDAAFYEDSNNWPRITAFLTRFWPNWTNEAPATYQGKPWIMYCQPVSNDTRITHYIWPVTRRQTRKQNATDFSLIVDYNRLTPVERESTGLRVGGRELRTRTTTTVRRGRP